MDEDLIAVPDPGDGVLGGDDAHKSLPAGSVFADRSPDRTGSDSRLVVGLLLTVRIRLL